MVVDEVVEEALEDAADDVVEEVVEVVEEVVEEIEDEEVEVVVVEDSDCPECMGVFPIALSAWVT